MNQKEAYMVKFFEMVSRLAAEAEKVGLEKVARLINVQNLTSVERKMLIDYAFSLKIAEIKWWLGPMPEEPKTPSVTEILSRIVQIIPVPSNN